MEYKKPVLIAEIGCNHKGSFDTALKMIDVAAECGADIVKFQKRTPKELLTEEEYNSPHPVPSNSYGETYGEHREFLEFSVEEHKQLKNYCEKAGVEYSVSVWDDTSRRQIIEEVKPKHLKIPSALATKAFFIEQILLDYKGMLHISTGMTSESERRDLIIRLMLGKRLPETVIYHCVSTYPSYFEEINLQTIEDLSRYAGKNSNIGFSGHHKGIAIDIMAYALGAQYIERHFTLDRTWKGTDHAASLEPTGLRKLKRDLLAAWKVSGKKSKEMSHREREMAQKLRWDREELDM